MQDDPTHHWLSRTNLLVAGLLLAFLALFGWQSWLRAQEEQRLQLRTVAELTERATDRYFGQMQVALGGLAADLVAIDGLRELPKAQQLLSRFKDQHVDVLAVNLLALDGRFLATSTTTRLTGLPTAQNLRDFAAIVAGLKVDTPMELSRPLIGPAVKRWILPMRYTVRDERGRAVAFIVASTPVEMLQSFWSQAPVIAKASIALVRDDGYLISRYPVPPGTLDTELYGKPRDGAVFRFISTRQWPAHGQVDGPNVLAGEAYSSVFKRLEHFPVTLVAGVPRSEIRAEWWGRVRVPFLCAALVTLVWTVGIAHLQRREHTWSAERRRAEEKMRLSEALLDRTGQVARVGGWSVDLVSKSVAWSAQTRRIHEVDEDFMPTLESAVAFYDAEARAVIETAVEAGSRGGAPWDLELPLVTALGKSMWVRAQGEAEFEDGRPVRLFGTIQDVTEYRARRIELRQEQALRSQAEQHALELDRLLHEREEMLDVLAHEVRQPLNNASAALQSANATLAHADEPGTQLSLQRAQAVLSQVLANIDNTLAVAALLASPSTLRREDTDVDLLVSLSIDDMPVGQRHRIHIARATATRTAAMDLGLMRLALRNLLVNALQHGPAGSVVTVHISDSDDPLALVIDVTDQGAGIESALAGRLFERGSRGSKAMGQPGHGLGLYIVKRVMDLHGGSVHVVHASGPGCTMRLVIDQSGPP